MEIDVCLRTILKDLDNLMQYRLPDSSRERLMADIIELIENAK